MKTITTHEAIERIRRVRFSSDDELEGRAKAGRSLAHLIATGQIALYAARGLVMGHTCEYIRTHLEV